MWGNRNGWLISLAIVVVLSAMFAYAWHEAGRMTLPTELTQKPETLAPIALPIDPARVLPLEFPGSGDGGRLYWEAIEKVQKDPKLYENFKPDLKSAASYPALAPVLEAAAAPRADIFQKQPDAVVRYGAKPALRALETLGIGCIRLGVLSAQAKDLPGAKKYLNAAYVLGLRMYQDRQSRAELDCALGLMASSVTVLGQIAKEEKNQTLAEHITDFVTQYKEYDKNHIKVIERAITSIDDKVMRQYVGDVIKMAQESKEPVWRNEATLRLGMYRFNSPLPGDRLAAGRAIRQLVLSDDAAVKAAALAARELTLSEYHKLGSE